MTLRKHLKTRVIECIINMYNGIVIIWAPRLPYFGKAEEINMDLLIVPVPIFSRDIAVEAYMFRYHSGNDILESRRGASRFDGVMNSAPLQMLNTVDVETFTMGKPLFVPVTSYMMLADLDRQCSQPPEKVVFLMDGTMKSGDEYIENIKRLKSLGYVFGIQKIDSAEAYAPLLDLCDYIFFDHRIIDTREQQILRLLIMRDYKHLKHVYTHITTMDMFKDVAGKAPGWYEGRFYRTPVTKNRPKVSPLQINLINLLNVVRDEDFEFTKVSAIIAKDPALSAALLKLVNSAFFGPRHKISTINQAVTMLGQKEVRKWITTAVSKLLGSDKPNEVSRISLIRARFAENLAVKFGMKADADSLFLMGLFSVLDAILEIPMEDALKLVHVSDDISNALINKKGKFYPVYEFIQMYESANWKGISRVLIINELSAADVYGSYLDSLCWYRDILTDSAN